MVLEFIKEPCLVQYRELINYACSNSDAIMMVFSYKKGDIKNKETMMRIRDQLSPWRIKTRYDPQWPTTKSNDLNYVFIIELFKPSREIKRFLLQIDHLYGWGGSLPFDISFFRNNYCWFATCSHEQCGWVITDNSLPSQFNDFLEIVEDPNELTYYEEY